MSRLKNLFNDSEIPDVLELTKIRFKEGHQPRNATDYYYHPKTKTIYSCYWGEKPHRWKANPEIDMNSIESPKEVKTKSKGKKSEDNQLKLKDIISKSEDGESKSEEGNHELKEMNRKLERENRKLKEENKQLKGKNRKSEKEINELREDDEHCRCYLF
jgi:hypothetical protein